ncbi:MAG: PEP-CTERM sorting domain-containing protein [Opitutales bacterium]
MSALPFASAHAQSLTIFTLPEGAEILQVTGAVPNLNPGGQATADTRTLYVFEPDIGDAFPNVPDFPSTPPAQGVVNPWAWVYATSDAEVSDLDIDLGISAEVDLVLNPNSGAGLQWITIDGNPLYQFAGDSSELDANGNFGPWNYVLADGSVSQSVFGPTIPEPSTYGMIGVVALGSAILGKRARSKDREKKAQAAAV